MIKRQRRLYDENDENDDDDDIGTVWHGSWHDAATITTKTQQTRMVYSRPSDRFYFHYVIIRLPEYVHQNNNNNNDKNRRVYSNTHTHVTRHLINTLRRLYFKPTLTPSHRS